MNVLYSIKEGYRNFRSHGYATGVSVSVITLVLVLVGYIAVFTINVYGLLNILRGRIGLVVFIEYGASNEAAQSVGAQISRLENVSRVHCVSPEDALEQFKKDDVLSRQIQINGSNPLPYSYEVKLKDVTSDTVSNTVTQIRAIDYVDTVRYGQGALELLDSIGAGTRTLVTILGIVLLGIALVVISYTTGINARLENEKVKFLTMLGASRSFHVLTFFTEGALQGILGGLIASGIVLFTSCLVGKNVHLVHINPFLFAGGLTVLGLILGLTGESFSVCRSPKWPKIRRGKGSATLLVLLLLVFVIGTPRYCVAKNTTSIDEYNHKINEKQSELKEIESKIKKSEEESTRLEKHEKAVNIRIKRIRKQLERSTKRLSDLVIQERQTRAKLRQVSAKYRKQLNTNNEIENQVSDGLRAIYTHGWWQADPVQEFALLCFSNDINQYLVHTKWSEAVLIQKQQLLKQMRKEVLILADNRDELSRQKTRLSNLRSRTEKEARHHRALIKEKKSILARVNTQKEQCRIEMDELKSTAVELQQLINRFEQQKEFLAKTETVELSELKGNLAWPVKGKVIEYYGKHYDSNLGSIINSHGIRISAERGDVVRSVASGEVLFADVFRSYGQMVIVVHAGSYYSVYSGLGDTKVDAGDHISPGQVVGNIGENGCLYFEFRENGKPVNPVAWLSQ